MPGTLNIERITGTEILPIQFNADFPAPDNPRTTADRAFEGRRKLDLHPHLHPQFQVEPICGRQIFD